jgi:hypothetical protein
MRELANRVIGEGEAGIDAGGGAYTAWVFIFFFILRNKGEEVGRNNNWIQRTDGSMPCPMA